MILGSNPLSNDWKPLSLRCSSKKQSLLSSVGHHSQNDRFVVDGVGGEEDEKCWSRTGHWVYRLSERRFPPSPSLTRAFGEYESLHARCTAGKKWESLSELTESGSNSEGSCKYLLYIEGPEGLGNRFMSLVTAFAYALITDRVLLLDFRRNMSGLVCEPFQGSSWTLPTTFPFEKVDELPSLEDVADEGLEKMAAVKLNLRHVQSERDRRFFCSDVQERLGKLPVIGWKSNQYYVPRLYAIPEFWEKLNPLFGDPGLIFTQLSRVLLLPENAVWAKTERAYRAYLATSKKLVGIQVRSPNFNSFEQPIYDRVVQCLMDDNMLPNISQQQPHKVTKIPEEGTAIFVASLQREYYEKLKEVYAEKGAEDGTLVTVHTMATEGLENVSYDQSVKAYVDMLLLSFSDSLLTSGWSTFGYVAQGLGAVLPHIVNTDIEQPQSCDVGQSVEPCTHYPHFSSCPMTSSNESSEHGEWMRKHLRPCQDQPAGIQLVSS